MADVTLSRGVFVKIATTTSTPTSGLPDGVHADTFVLPAGATKLLTKVESSAANVDVLLQLFAEHQDSSGNTLHTVNTTNSSAIALTNVALAEESGYFFSARWDVAITSASRLRVGWGTPTNSGTVSIWVAAI